jgi:penicillin-binding protein 1A
VKSINTVPVRLARDYLGIDPIIKLTKAMGVESPLIHHKTMVLGTSGMTVMDQATGYLVFADGGFSGIRHGITQITTQSGKLLYDHAKDDPKPVRVLSPQAVSSMNTMLVQVPEWGTGRRAALAITRAAGKTGTTQSYRDAWFCGFTGNFTAAVWFGNDNYAPTNRLTGGSLPAMTWKRMMSYANANVELKPIPGIENPFLDPEAVAKARAAEADSEDADIKIDRPPTLSAATAKVLKGLAKKFEDAPALKLPPGYEKLSAL